MDKETRNKITEELLDKLIKLQIEADSVQKEIRKLDNERECDLCGREYKLFNGGGISGGPMGGTDFEMSELPPIIIDGKEIVCICSVCLIKKMKETK